MADFKEDDIRDKNMRLEARELYRKDQERILSHSKDFVEVNCPACDQSEKRDAWKRDGFTYKECCHCGTIYVSPRPTKNMLAEHYATSLSEKYWAKNIYPKSELARLNHLIRPRVERILEILDKHNLKPKKLMDIGAGYCTFVSEAVSQNMVSEAIAIEPNFDASQRIEDSRITVINDVLENVNMVDVDIITCFELIEHVFSPLDLISNLHKNVTSQGILVITTPNIQGFDLLTLRDKSDNTTAPDHINYFNIESLTSLLKKGGFRIVEVLTPGKLDAELVRNKALDGVVDLSNQYFLKRILVDEWDRFGDIFQEFLSVNKMSSHLWVVAQKK